MGTGDGTRRRLPRRAAPVDGRLGRLRAPAKSASSDSRSSRECPARRPAAASQSARPAATDSVSGGGREARATRRADQDGEAHRQAIEPEHLGGPLHWAGHTLVVVPRVVLGSEDRGRLDQRRAERPERRPLSRRKRPGHQLQPAVWPKRAQRTVFVELLARQNLSIGPDIDRAFGGNGPRIAATRSDEKGFAAQRFGERILAGR